MDFLSYKSKYLLIINKEIMDFYVIFCVFREEKQHIKIPWNLEDAKNLGTVLYRYKGDHFYHVYFGVSIMYILYPFKSK